MQKESRTCQKFSIRILLWQIISFYESGIDTAQRLRVLRAEGAKRRSCVKPGRGGTGQGKGRISPSLFLEQGPGHRSAAPRGLLQQPKRAGDFAALGKKLKQENSPIKVSPISMQPGEKHPVRALVLIFATQSFSWFLPPEVSHWLYWQTKGARCKSRQLANRSNSPKADLFWKIPSPRKNAAFLKRTCPHLVLNWNGFLLF